MLLRFIPDQVCFTMRSLEPIEDSSQTEKERDSEVDCSKLGGSIVFGVYQESL
jgi:hypothetical protein